MVKIMLGNTGVQLCHKSHHCPSALITFILSRTYAVIVLEQCYSVCVMIVQIIKPHKCIQSFSDLLQSDLDEYITIQREALAGGGRGGADLVNHVKYWC